MAEEGTPEKEKTREEKRVEIRTERRARRRGRRRSLLWPLLLVSVGTLWLLANLNVIPVENLTILLRLWPLLLVVVGVDILVGRSSPLLSGLIVLAALVLAAGLVVVGPALGLETERTPRIFGLPVYLGEMEVKHDQFSAPIGEATSARVNLDLSFEPTTVDALPSSDDLIAADLDYVGDIIFQVSGERQKTVSLSQSDV